MGFLGLNVACGSCSSEELMEPGHWQLGPGLPGESGTCSFHASIATNMCQVMFQVLYSI